MYIYIKQLCFLGQGQQVLLHEKLLQLHQSLVSKLVPMLCSCSCLSRETVVATYNN